MFVVFDESDTGDPGVPALALGPLVRARSYVTGATSHYGLLRTIEEGFGPAAARPVCARHAGHRNLESAPASAKEGSAARP